MISTVVTWVIAHGWRQLLGAAVMLGLFIFVLAWNAHERSIGEAQCQLAQQQAFDHGQAAADKESARASAAVHAQYDPLDGAIQDATARYNAARAQPSDCPSVDYKRKARP